MLEEEEVMGIMSPEYAWSAAIGGFILSALMVICACCLCDTWTQVKKQNLIRQPG